MESENETLAKVIGEARQENGYTTPWFVRFLEDGGVDISELLDRIEEAHKREVAELYAIIEKSKKDAETYRDERDGAMTHWREEKAKVAELRECLTKLRRMPKARREYCTQFRLKGTDDAWIVINIGPCP